MAQRPAAFLRLTLDENWLAPRTLYSRHKQSVRLERPQLGR